MIEAGIIGTGSYVPISAIGNEEVCTWVDTSDEWIVERTGIRERHLSRGEDTSALASEAADRALRDAGLEPSKVGLVITATVTSDHLTPSVACQVQKRLGLSQAACFDLSAGCTGFVYGLMTAHALLNTGAFETAVVIGAETLSKVVNWDDRQTCVLFGDGAGAVVLEAGHPGLIGHVIHSDGTRGDVLVIPGLPPANPLYRAEERPHHILMDGPEVFKFAVKAMRDAIDEVLGVSGVPKDDISWVVPHQANQRIIDLAVGRTGISRDKFYTNLERLGNTSAASIPIALDEMNRKGLLADGMKIITVGFGAGLTWGANLMQWTAKKSLHR